MTAAIDVAVAGTYTTLQDLGRFGYQALGVPVAGALDSVSLRLVNALVGNNQQTAALEFFYGGPTLEVAAGSIRVAAAGADIEIMGKRSWIVPAWQSVRLVRGDIFRVGALRDSSCGYLAIAGGFALTLELGSLSTYTRSRIGGYEGRVLRAGDQLPLALNEAGERQEVRLGQPPDLAVRDPVRVVLGPQQELFTKDSIHALVTETFTVSGDADRMGLRLDGPKLTHEDGYNIVSDGIVTGAIQVPGSGQPIVLLADHQTTGGYPKIGTVVWSDLSSIGRLRPGDSIRFREVSVEHAEQQARDFEDDINRRASDLVAPVTAAVLDEAALISGNLISGVVDAMD
jgi:biotin-dependent carboxylase-like uncharacterized protein